MKEKLFEAMTEAIEKKNELELQLAIAAREARALEAAYKAYIQVERNQNI